MRTTPGVGSCKSSGGTGTAAATTELASVLPIVLFVVFSTIEFSPLNMLKHFATVSV
jgi:hypothetical protein